MFNYAKAYFRVWAFLESLALSHYWPVVKNLPSILATRSAGEADFQYETQLKALGGLQKSGFLRGTDVPGAPGRLAVWSEDEGSLEVEDALVCPSFSHGSHHDFKEPRTRGYKIQFKERNKPVRTAFKHLEFISGLTITIARSKLQSRRSGMVVCRWRMVFQALDSLGRGMD